MARKRYPEEIVSILRQAEVLQSYSREWVTG